MNPVILSYIALVFGFFFFVYSLRYYFITIWMLLKSVKNPNGSLAYLKSDLYDTHQGKRKINPDNIPYTNNGVNANIRNRQIKKEPFISVHLPLYNEPNVVSRLIEACTKFDYTNYEILVLDDSTDNTSDIIKNTWANHPKVKHVHRVNRVGYKGGALQNALQIMDKKTEFIAVFDADFIPFPNTLQLFVKYFRSVNGHGARYKKSTVAALQGYQWHVLNKNENWITRGIRSEFSGGYVIERSATELFHGIKQIAGSNFMIRADVIKKIGWKHSITEDFELTLRLYNAGYKVAYTPYIQAPAECPAEIPKLIKQRMRWAEGHSFNVKKYFWDMITSRSLTLMEKLEFLYLTPYYLQSVFFLIGTIAWVIAEIFFDAPIPGWTSTLGWTLLLSNMVALPLMNGAGLFFEEGKDKDYLGLFSFIALTYLLVPYNAIAALRGFFEKEEGDWIRTNKTGKITEKFEEFNWKRWITDLLPKKEDVKTIGTLGIVKSVFKKIVATNPFVKLFKAPKPIRALFSRNVPFITLVMFLSGTFILYIFSRNIPYSYADPAKQYFTGTPVTGVSPTSNELTEGVPSGIFCQGIVFSDSTTSFSWVTAPYPIGGDNASLSMGSYEFSFYADTVTGSSTYTISFGSVDADGSNYTNYFTTGPHTLSTNGTESVTVFNGDSYTFTSANPRRLKITITKTDLGEGDYFTLRHSCAIGANSYVALPAITVPEHTALLALVIPTVPLSMAFLSRRRRYDDTLVERKKNR